MKTFICLFLFLFPFISKAQMDLNPSFYVKNLFDNSKNKIDFYIYYCFQSPLKVQNANIGFDSQSQKISDDVEYFMDPTYHYDITPNTIFYLGIVSNIPQHHKKINIYHSF